MAQAEDVDNRVVYFFADYYWKFVKIGVASNPERRYDELQKGQPLPLSPLGVCHGGLTLERSLKKQFRHLRLSGEWFLLADELKAKIIELCPDQRRWLEQRDIVLENWECRRRASPPPWEDAAQITALR